MTPTPRDSTAPPGGGRVARTLFAVVVGLAMVLAIIGTGRAVDANLHGDTLPDGVAFTSDRGRIGADSPQHLVLGQRAIAELDFDWERRLPGWRVDFVTGNSDIAGYTWSNEQRIQVFIRQGETPERAARILAHELGHAVDVTWNTPEERSTWLVQRGIDPSTPWWPGNGRIDFRTGAGDWAEVFAAWLVGTDDFRSEIGPVPTPGDFEIVAAAAGG